MNYKITYSDDYLAHHGILGQKWGIRRYQNEDGSLTPAGQARLKRNEAYRDKLIANKQRKIAKRESRIKRAQEELDELNTSGTASKIYKDRIEEIRRESMYKMMDDNGNIPVVARVLADIEYGINANAKSDDEHNAVMKELREQRVNRIKIASQSIEDTNRIIQGLQDYPLSELTSKWDLKKASWGY